MKSTLLCIVDSVYVYVKTKKMAEDLVKALQDPNAWRLDTADLIQQVR